MRDTLYFKDDDSRLSFLSGNYVTLTNMDRDDLDRIIRYRMMPVNVSVHSTNPELRAKMLGNRFAGDVLQKIRLLVDGGINVNAQIVLCKGLNDGTELDRTLSDLSALCPGVASISVVPVGLTKWREGLYPLETFTPDDAANVPNRSDNGRISSLRNMARDWFFRLMSFISRQGRNCLHTKNTRISSR